MFCDLVGSTAQGERLDPEDLHALLSRYHAGVRAELERFGGTLEKFIGDAVVAVFGAPLAHEDDPERAVRAALAVLEWVHGHSEFRVRMGVNTGEALVVMKARSLEGEHLASGDVLNTAARIQSAAPVDGILVGEQTYRATNRVVEYREHEPVEARGKAEPVRVWEVVRVRPRSSVQAPLPALVGRERELALLRDGFEHVRAEREPKLMTIVGVPGIGKSRVVQELSRMVASDPGGVVWRSGRCLPYGQGVSFWALGEMVKSQAGILETDAPEMVEEKLASNVAALVPAADVEWVMRSLRPLVGKAGEERSQDIRGQAFPAWRRFLEGIARGGAPTVLSFEDLHWADDGLLDFIEELAEWAAGVPMLVLCTARPELLSRRSGWGEGRRNTATLSLPPLSADETRRLVHDLLARAALPAELQQTLLERAGGNPLYAEEFARLVSERGPSDIALPESVQGIIAARLDALAPVQKRVLQDAAVVGEVFWAGAVAALDVGSADELEERLRELERRELVRREPKSSVEGEIEYAFHHVLTRDVAYAQIPRLQRSERHRGAAEWIASLGRPEDHAELIAHHYLEAIDYARASRTDPSEFAGAARAALRDAGDRASSLGAYPAAARYLKAALDLVADDDPERGGLLYRYGAALLWGENGGQDALEQAVTLLAPLDRETAARATLLLAYLEWTRLNPEAVTRWYREADELLVDLPDSMVRTESMSWQAYYALITGDGERGSQLAREALGRLEESERPDLRARCFDVLGAVRVGAGDEGGLDDQRRSAQIARDARAIWELHVALTNVGWSMVSLGLLRALTPNWEEQRRAVEEFGATWDVRSGLVHWQAFIGYFQGHWDAAMDVTAGFLAALEDGMPNIFECPVRDLRVLIALARDQLGQARSEIERTVELARRTRELQNIHPSLVTRGCVLLAAGDRGAALADLDELLPDGATLAANLTGAARLPEFAWLALDLARGNEAESIVSASTSPRWTAVGKAILGDDPVTAAELLSKIGDKPAEAYARLRAGGEHVQKALAFYRSVGATRYIREAESQLAASA